MRKMTWISLLAMVGFSTVFTGVGAASATDANGPGTTTSAKAHHGPVGPMKCGGFLGDGINIHSAPAVGASVVGIGYNDDCVDYNSNVVSEWVTCDSGRSSIWWNITDEDTGVTGWVSDCYIRV